LVEYVVDRVVRDVYVLKVNDRHTKYFEALWEIPEGISYNAYLVKTGEGAILIDGWKSIYSGKLLELLERLIDRDELRYIIVQHTEPDHTGSLEDVARWAENATVLGHPMAKRIMGSGYPIATSRFKPVRDGETIELGGVKLQFIYAPWLHWPDTIYTWMPDSGVLFTCDSFGAYGATSCVFDDECRYHDLILRWTKKYVVTVIGSYRKFIIRALEKIKKLGVKPRIIAPGHGVVWRKDPSLIVDYYERLATGVPHGEKITVIYASMYGSTEAAAVTLARHLNRRGAHVVLHPFTDTTRSLLSEILADVIDSKALVIAAPTYEAGLFPLMELVLDEICAKASGEKPFAIISSYGWGGIAAKRIREKLESCGFKLAGVYEEQMVSPQGLVSDESALEALAAKLLG